MDVHTGVESQRLDVDADTWGQAEHGALRGRRGSCCKPGGTLEMSAGGGPGALTQ